MKKVWVVTGLELGWDCVVAVFDTDSMSIDEVLREFPEDSYVVHERTVETSLNKWKSE